MRLWLPNSELKAEGTEFDTGTARPVAPKEPPSSANQPGHWTSSLACGASPYLPSCARDVMQITKKRFPSLRSTPRGCRMVRSDAARAAIGGDGLPPCCRQSHRPRGRRSRPRRLPPHSGHAVTRLRGDARGRDGGVREELAAAVAAMRMRGSRRLSPNNSLAESNKSDSPVLINSLASGATERALPTELGAPAVISGERWKRTVSDLPGVHERRRLRRGLR